MKQPGTGAIGTEVSPRRPTRLDGRAVVLGAVLLWLAIPIIGALRGSSPQTWRLLGVEPLSMSFGDFRGVAASWDSYREGFAPLWETPHDPWPRPMLYPRLWL